MLFPLLAGVLAAAAWSGTATAGGGFRKGPYLQNVTPDGITVMTRAEVLELERRFRLLVVVAEPTALPPGMLSPEPEPEPEPDPLPPPSVET